MSVKQKEQPCPSEEGSRCTLPGLHERAHLCPFRAKLLLLGFSPATETLKAAFSLWLLAETQWGVSRWVPKLCRVNPRESITPSASQNHRTC